MSKALAASRLEYVPVVPTLADGLAGQIDEEGLAIGQFAIDELRIVEETEVADAIAWVSNAHDMRVEGAGAGGVATARRADARLDGPGVIVLSGGNIDDTRWRDVVAARTRLPRDSRRVTTDPSRSPAPGGASRPPYA